MTCNPAIATCLDTASRWESTVAFANGLCVPVAPETALTYSSYSEGASEVPWSDAAPRGALGYFRPALAADAPHCAADALPPMDQDLPLAAYHTELPEELRPYVTPLLRLEMEFGIPVSFRIANVRLSTGEVLPQIYFFRTGSEPGAPSSGEPGSGGIGTGGSRPSGFGNFVSIAGSAILAVGFDHFLIQPLVDNGIIPQELRSPVVFGSMMVSYTALYRAGLIRTAPSAALPQIPALIGYQILASLLLESVGMEPGLPRDLASVILSGLAVGITGSGEALTLAELETLSSGAATLRAGAMFARALGYVALINIGMQVVTWATSHPIAALDEVLGDGTYEDNLRAWNLTMRSHEIINQEDCGAILAGAFGMFMMVADGGLVMFDGAYEDYLLDRRSRIQRDLVAGSDEFGRSMHDILTSILYRHIYITQDETSGELEIASVDWAGFREEIRTFYENEENEETIETGYKLVDDLTGHRTRSGIEGLIEVVSENGEIEDLDGFREYMRNYVDRALTARTERQNARAIELGLMEEINGVMMFRAFTPDSDYTEAQREFLEGEALRLAEEIRRLAILRQALTRSNPA